MSADMKAKLTSPKAILRIVELIFSIITFALVAEYSGYSKVDFTLFTGITTMILCLVFLGLYVARMDDSPTVSLFELIINVLFWVFWLSTAAAVSSIVSDINGASFFGNWKGDADKFRASCAFAWLTFFLWTASTALSVMDTLKGRRGGGAAPAAPAAPAVAMV
ncbi:hypothetical protein Ndes2526B_g06953 [Nannochloris sp. 'desiccata']|nr:hypothetical protein KSW81_004964 [Chlorella desiccata (nom. nud.)]KAH7618052.1 hypothetical protein NADE_000253 [Chlorella desiccata (nom. nud.)]